MAKSSGEDDKLRIRPRALSLFMCKEMLYDYISEELDPERKKAVDNFLKTSAESQAELNCLKQGIEYCQTLSKTEISEPLLKRIQESKTVWSKIGNTFKWSYWPDSVKWSLEALGISVVVVLVALSLGPKLIELWPTTKDQKVLLAEVDSQPIENQNTEVSEATVEKSEDEKLNKDTDANKDTDIAVVSEAEKPKLDAVTETKTDAKVEVIDSAEDVSAKTPDKTIASEEVKAVKPKSTTGYLYRAFMNIENVDAVADGITEVLTVLGATKAGQVQLGWRREKGVYYHFSMPEKNYEEMLTRLKTYGEVRITKDPHPRVMPEGVIRLILWVEDVTLSQ